MPSYNLNALGHEHFERMVQSLLKSGNWCRNHDVRARQGRRERGNIRGRCAIPICEREVER